MRHQMEALNQAIADSTLERQADLAERMAETAEMLRTFSRERIQASEELRAALAADREERSEEVCALLADANAERVAYAKELQQATQIQTKELIQDRLDRCQEVADMMHGFRESRLEMSEELSTTLLELGESRRQEVADMMDGFRSARIEMAQEMAESLAESVRETREFVSGLSVWQGGVPIQHARYSAPANSSVPNYLLRGRNEETKPMPRIVNAFELAAPVAAPQAQVHAEVVKPVQRAIVPQKKTVEPIVAVKKAEPVKAGRPSGKALGKSKKR